MRVEWLPEAVQNRRDQIAYIAERDVRAAVAMGDAIEDMMGFLKRYPQGGRTGRVAGTREMTIPGTPFIVIYRLEAEAIVILRILHGAQRWPPEF